MLLIVSVGVGMMLGSISSCETPIRDSYTIPNESKKEATEFYLKALEAQKPAWDAATRAEDAMYKIYGVKDPQKKR